MLDVIILLGIFFVTTLQCIPISDFYPFGNSSGDSVVPLGDDLFSGPISISIGFPYFNSYQSELFVSTNGVISFKSGVTSYIPQAFPLNNSMLITPFWADVDTRGIGAIYYRETTNSAILDAATKEIKNAFPTLTNFKALWCFIGTWYQVGYYSLKKDANNTFQVLLTTDGVYSFSIFNYLDNGINWANGSSSAGIPAQAGFNAGDGLRYEIIPSSRTLEILNIETTSNVDIAGKYIFRIDGDVETAGCKNKTNITLTTFPLYGHWLGGTEVTIIGPCLSVSNNLTCKFDKQIVNGSYVDENHAVCISPTANTTGKIPLLFSVDELKYEGYYTYLTEERYYDVIVNLEATYTNDSNFRIINSNNLPSHLLFKWNGDDISSYDRRRTLATSGNVNIELVELNPETEEIITIATIAQNIENIGSFELDTSILSSISNSFIGSFRVLGSEAETLWSNFIYWIDESQEETRESLCNQWYENEPDPSTWVNKLPECPPNEELIITPCTNNQLPSEWTIDKACKSPDSCGFHKGADHCIRSKKQNGNSHGQQCCFNGNQELIISDINSRGTPDYANSDIGLIPWQHFKHDVYPHLLCCIDQPESVCLKYHEKRPVNTGANFIAPAPCGGQFGDPHIRTLDSYSLTCNGIGEYYLIKTINNLSPNLIVQGRTENVSNLGSTFSTMVAKEDNSDTIQIEWSNSIGMVVRINGEIESIDFDNQPFNGVEITKSNNSVLIKFESGASIFVNQPTSISYTAFSVQIRLPDTYLSRTQGLFGTYNYNSSDDLLTSDGSTLSTSSSSETIYYEFCQSWLINSNESLFTYLYGYNTYDYIDSSFVPTFEPVFANSSLQEAAESICGTNAECLFDIYASGDLNFGQVTLQSQLDLNLTDEIVNTVISCNPTCKNSGVCVNTNKCSCLYGYSGSYCETKDNDDTNSANNFSKSELILIGLIINFFIA